MSRSLRRFLFSIAVLILAVGVQTAPGSSTMAYHIMYPTTCWDFGGTWCPIPAEENAACQAAYGTDAVGCEEGCWEPSSACDPDSAPEECICPLYGDFHYCEVEPGLEWAPVIICNWPS